MAKVTLETEMASVSAHVPAKFLEEIGRIVTRWAHLEYVIQSFVWELAQATQQIGMLAIREPRVPDRLQLVSDLAEIRGVRINPKQLRNFKSALTTLQNSRDLVAHGAWVKSPSRGWGVVQTRGNWEQNVDIEHRSRKIAPEGIPTTPKALNAIAAEIIVATEEFRSLRNTVRERIEEASRERHPQQ